MQEASSKPNPARVYLLFGYNDTSWSKMWKFLNMKDRWWYIMQYIAMGTGARRDFIFLIMVLLKELGYS